MPLDLSRELRALAATVAVGLVFHVPIAVGAEFGLRLTWKDNLQCSNRSGSVAWELRNVSTTYGSQRWRTG